MAEPTMEQLQEQLAALKGELEAIRNPPPDDDNVMMREARIGPAVRDYIPPELADRFPDLAQGAGRPDFIPDEKYLAKKRRTQITKFQEEYGVNADPLYPPVKLKPVPFLNPLTGEREVPKPGPHKMEDGSVKIAPPKRTPPIRATLKNAKKKPGRPKKAAANDRGKVSSVGNDEPQTGGVAAEE